MYPEMIQMVHFPEKKSEKNHIDSIISANHLII